MADASKPVRLNKIAREFNLGIQTIVDFLASKGMEVDAKPNTKIDAEAYALIRSNFQDEKAAKEKAVSSANRAVVERESVTLASARKTAAPQEEAEVEIDLSIFQKSQQQPEVERIEPEAPAEPAPAPKEKAAEAPAEPEADAASPVKVLSKVDLDAVAKKPKAKTKAEKEAEKEKLAQESAEIAKKEAAAQAAEKAAAEQAAEDKAAKPEPPKVDKLETKIEKLSGPTVVGKIELPVEKKKTAADKSDDNKRKRKRITKVDVERQARTAGGQRGDRGRGRRNEPKKEVSQADIQKEIKETLARLSGGKKSNAAKMRRAKRSAVAERAEQELQRQQEEAMTLQLTEFVTVAELANMMNANVNEVISACMTLGIMVSINQRLDSETITIIAEEFGYEANFVSAEVQEAIEVEEDSEEDLTPRPPIVTVMGHVDHGKTSLLDFIRNANVIAGEAGGITQHIGAYHVTLPQGGQMTFLDTPGHEAFTAMRARGAQVTDIAIIVVAADDAVMPQTKEAINHAQAAGIPMVIAINKMDRPEANADKIRQELSEMNVLVEEWGGKFQSQEISAKNGTNIEELLEKVLLEAEMLDLKANPGKRAIGTVVESSLDKGRGYVTNLLVEGGTMRIGDAVLAGQFSGKVKAMFNERGARVDEAGPSVPVSILGFDGAPNAGDKFHVFEDEREARNIAVKRQQLQREQGVRSQRSVTLEELGRRIAVGEFKELNLIVKGDVDGSIEALSDSLQKLSTEKVQVNIIHKAVGQVSESDILLASASSAIIIGFQVRPSGAARRLAEKEGVQIKLYSVIYKAIEEMKDAMEGLLSAKIEENVVGSAEIRETFKISKVGTIAGCFVIDGNIKRNNKVRVIREGVVVYTGTLGSLKRFKDDVKEVAKGFECGLNIDRFNDIKVGDVVEAYEEVEVKQTLED